MSHFEMLRGKSAPQHDTKLLSIIDVIQQNFDAYLRGHKPSTTLRPETPGRFEICGWIEFNPAGRAFHPLLMAGCHNFRRNRKNQC
jgi:hypothetical protein